MNNRTLQPVLRHIVAGTLLSLAGVVAGLLTCHAFGTEPEKNGQPPTRQVPIPVEAEKILAMALKEVRDAKPELPGEYQILADIAKLQAKIGKPAASKETFALAFKAIELLPKDFPLAIAYSNLAEAQCHAGDTTSGRETFERAIQAARTGKGNDNWQYIARAQARVGEWAAARETAGNISQEFYREQVLSDVAVGRAKFGDPKAARAAIDRCLNLPARLR